MPNNINSFAIKPTENPIGGKIIQEIILKPPILISKSVSDSDPDPIYDSLSESKSTEQNIIYDRVYQEAYALYSTLFSLNRN